LTQQLDKVVIEISVQALRLRANPQRLQGPNICHQWIEPSDKTSYLN